MRVVPLILLASIILIVGCSSPSENNKTYSLTTKVIPTEAGSVNPESGLYDDKENISIQAAPVNGWKFSGWKGDVVNNQNPLSITINKDITLEAHFERELYSLSVQIEGNGKVEEELIINKSYSFQSEVRLTAIADTGWIFSNWDGGLSGSDNPTEITITDSTSVTAVFDRKKYDLIVETEGEGIVLEEILTSKSLPFETEVRLTAIADTGWVFSKWDGDLVGSENPTEITIKESMNVTAVFTRQNYDLTVTIFGEGDVLEELLPSRSFPFESVVRLTAQPTTNWEFKEWGNDISGNQNPVSVSITSETNITATFIFEEPEVQITDVSNIEMESASITSKVIDLGTIQLIKKGICYSDKTEPTIKDTCFNSAGDSENLEWITTLENLQPQSKYFVRAYIFDGNRNYYSNEVQFTTLDLSKVQPTLKIKQVSNLTNKSVTIEVDILNEGSNPITEKGIQYKTESSEYVTISNGIDDSDYSVKISDLQSGTTYFARAFASNSVGTTFTSDTTFTTLSVFSDVDVYALAAQDLTQEIFINWIDRDTQSDGSVHTLTYLTEGGETLQITSVGKPIPFSSSHLYSVKLDRLTPDSQYFFTILTSDQKITREYTFKTLPATQSVRDIKIAFVSDIHIDRNIPSVIVMPTNPQNSMHDPRRMGNVANKTPDVLCIVGDIITNGYTVDLEHTYQYLRFFKDHISTYLNNDHLIPIMVVPGNHEVGFPYLGQGGVTTPTPTAGYFQLFFNNLVETTGYNFGHAKAGNYLQLIGMDVFSSTPDIQKEFFNNVVDNTVDNVIPFFHSPLLEGGERSLGDREFHGIIRENFAPFFAIQNNIYSYFTGHLHLRVRSKPWTVVTLNTKPEPSISLGNNQYLVVDETRNRLIEFGQGYRSNREPYTQSDKTWYLDVASVYEHNIFYVVTLKNGFHNVSEFNQDGILLYSKDLMGDP